MRIRNPPKFIMSISFIMSLIMTLLVFQCNQWEFSGRMARRFLSLFLRWDAESASISPLGCGVVALCPL